MTASSRSNRGSGRASRFDRIGSRHAGHDASAPAARSQRSMQAPQKRCMQVPTRRAPWTTPGRGGEERGGWGRSALGGRRAGSGDFPDRSPCAGMRVGRRGRRPTAPPSPPAHRPWRRATASRPPPSLTETHAALRVLLERVQVQVDHGARGRGGRGSGRGVEARGRGGERHGGPRAVTAGDWRLGRALRGRRRRLAGPAATPRRRRRWRAARRARAGAAAGRPPGLARARGRSARPGRGRAGAEGGRSGARGGGRAALGQRTRRRSP